MKNLNKIMNMDGVYLRRLYKTSCLAFRAENMFLRKGGVVFVGDSAVEFWNLDNYFPGLNAVNRGISGDTIEGIRGRLEESIFGLSPSLVVLSGGSNNFAVGYDDVETFIVENYRAIFSAIKTRLPQTKVIVQSVYPVSYISFRNRYRVGHGHIEAINNKLKELALAFGYTYADVYSVLTSGDEEFDTKYTKDGLHPNKEGYKAISDYLRPIIDEALASRDEEEEVDEEEALIAISKSTNDEMTSFVEKVLVSVLGWTTGILFCVGNGLAVSFTLGVILCIFGVVNLLLMAYSKRTLFRAMGVINGIIVAGGIVLCLNDLSYVVMLLIPVVMEVLGVIMTVDAFYGRFVAKKGTIWRLVIFAVGGGILQATGLLFLCNEELRAVYSQRVVGIMLCVGATLLMAFTIIGKSQKKSK